MNQHFLKIVIFFSVLVLITLGYWLLEKADPSTPSKTPETLAEPPKSRPTQINPLPAPQKAPLAEPKVEMPTPAESPLIIPQTFTLKSPEAQKEHGPTMPGSTPNPPPIEKKLLHLPNSPSEETQQLNYGYEGKEQDKYKLNLGVTDGGVSLQTKLKSDQAAKQVELEGVEIEIKLPK